MPVMVLKLVAVAFGCPWKEQEEIVPPEAAEFVWLALGGAHFCPLTIAQASAFFI